MLAASSLAVAAAAALVLGTQVAGTDDPRVQPRPPGELAPAPVVEAPSAPGTPEVSAPRSAPPFELPVRLGLGVGVGLLLDPVGSAPGFELWALVGPPRAPFWGEIAVSATPGRTVQAGRFTFAWRRGAMLSAGAAFRFARAPLEAVAGLQAAQLQASPLGHVDAEDFASLDAGGYAGLRALVPLGPVSGWLGARISGWFVEHRIEVGDPAAGDAASVPALGVWFGVGLEAGGQP